MGDQAKRVVFRYNDDDKDTDVEVDILGDLPQYAVGDIVARRGKSWKVVRVLNEQALIGSQPVPAYVVTVTDKTQRQAGSFGRDVVIRSYFAARPVSVG